MVIFRHARVYSTYPCQSVCHTFGFPFCQLSADMEVDKVTDMEVGKVTDMEVGKVTDMVTDMADDKKNEVDVCTKTKV